VRGFYELLEEVRKKVVKRLEEADVEVAMDVTELTGIGPRWWKASAGKVSLGIMPEYREHYNLPSACIIHIMNTNNEERRRIEEETGLIFHRSPYEPPSRETYDAEAYVPCDPDLMVDLFVKTVKAVKALRKA